MKNKLCKMLIFSQEQKTKGAAGGEGESPANLNYNYIIKYPYY